MKCFNPAQLAVLTVYDLHGLPCTRCSHNIYAFNKCTLLAVFSLKKRAALSKIIDLLEPTPLATVRLWSYGSEIFLLFKLMALPNWCSHQLETDTRRNSQSPLDLLAFPASGLMPASNAGTSKGAFPCVWKRRRKGGEFIVFWLGKIGKSCQAMNYPGSVCR